MSFGAFWRPPTCYGLRPTPHVSRPQRQSWTAAAAFGCPRRSSALISAWRTCKGTALGHGAAREAIVASQFLEDLRFWTDTNRRVALRALDIVEAVLRDPFAGLGAPEPLKYFGPNAWSRRLTMSDRIVCRVRSDRIEFLQARYHYGER